MTPLYLFDIDGTITPSRGKIDKVFESYFTDFCENNHCYLVTGSDQAKTIEQIGLPLYNKFKAQFQCSGNEVYEGNDNLIKSSDWKLSENAEYFLNSCLYESKFISRTGNHIEHRTGTINFSVVGRNATLGERKLYVEYDKTTNERQTIANAFNIMFPDLEATIGGETGLDISPKGKDKSQVLEYLDSRDIWFFGDACQKGGNDYPLASAITEKSLGYVYNVEDYINTWNILKEIDDAISSIR